MHIALINITAAMAITVSCSLVTKIAISLQIILLDIGIKSATIVNESMSYLYPNLTPNNADLLGINTRTRARTLRWVCE